MRHRLSPTAAWLLAVWALSSGVVGLELWTTPWGFYDEWAQVAQGWRWVQGDRLYLDAWEFIAPLPIMLSALGFWCLGGVHLEWPRLLAAGFAAVMLGALMRFALQAGARPLLVAPMALGLAFGTLPAYRGYYHHWVSWAFLALAWALAAEGMQRLRARYWFLAGLMLGAATLSTQSMAMVGLGSLAGALVLAARQDSWSWRHGRQAAAALVAGTLAPWALMSLVFLQQGTLGWFGHQVWVWPSGHYRSPGNVNDLWPFMDLDSAYFPMKHWGLSPWAWGAILWTGLGTSVLPFMAALGALACAPMWGLRWAQGRWPAVWSVAGMLALAVLLEGVHLLMGRGDQVHLRFASPLAWVAWALWATVLWPKGASGGWMQAQALRVPGLALMAFATLATASDWRTQRGLFRDGRWTWSVTQSYAQTPLVAALRAHVRPEDRFWAYPGSGVALLFSGARAGSPFTTLAPPSYRYHGPEEYARFRNAWAQHPPDAILISGRSGAQAEREWRGQPTLKGYRLVATLPGPPPEEGIPQELWLRVPQGPGNTGAQLGKPPAVQGIVK